MAVGRQLTLEYSGECKHRRCPRKGLSWFRSMQWRRERDSNPRYGSPYTRFRGVRFQPLTHLSAPRTPWNGGRGRFRIVRQAAGNKACSAILNEAARMAGQGSPARVLMRFCPCPSRQTNSRDDEGLKKKPAPWSGPAGPVGVSSALGHRSQVARALHWRGHVMLGLAGRS